MSRQKPLPIDLGDVCAALESADEGHRWYLDSSTGETVLINAEFDPQDYDGRSAVEIEGDQARYRRIPRVDGDTLLADMHDFASQMMDVRLKESLLLALSAPRPERRFKAVLSWLPEPQKTWQLFRQRCVEMRARDWLTSQGLSGA